MRAQTIALALLVLLPLFLITSCTESCWCPKPVYLTPPPELYGVWISDDGLFSWWFNENCAALTYLAGAPPFTRMWGGGVQKDCYSWQTTEFYQDGMYTLELILLPPVFTEGHQFTHVDDVTWHWISYIDEDASDPIAIVRINQ